MPFLDHLLTYKITAYNTRHQRGRKLSVGGLITPILCAAGVTQLIGELLNQLGMRMMREEEPELDRAESRAEDRAEDRAEIRSRSADWVSLSATTLRSMRLQG
ncbi:unnamed protein product [Microthlaspi erraticum]|uniref:Arabidopsis retrotransposon Orf1 C-terminal domain-containing protein n=1 Tax=Microthlaspi erraticum TaxID=1685480 RepID=A0A6D2K2Q5_9BRAS|nr:unnamed protein product [Microthlaspi erraticum]